jgi:hypothetical protein
MSRDIRGKGLSDLSLVAKQMQYTKHKGSLPDKCPRSGHELWRMTSFGLLYHFRRHMSEGVQGNGLEDSGIIINCEAHAIPMVDYLVNVPDPVMNSGYWRRYAFFDIQE